MIDFFDPAAVTAVDVLRVSPGWDSVTDWQVHQELATLDPPAATAAALLLAALPEDDPARCFVPVYGMRLWTADGGSTEVAICFRCSNGQYRGHLGSGWFTLDSAAPPSLELLALLRSYDPDAAERA
ncbi:hypothetical protein QEZ54_32385 [Catellatospora sp. KI3]|uniref:hypothetical protein n=1 Tax=Catellatospora sp. KI3 TaxID=3041620 RepID=UPI002482FF6F|nr:hypothetical protein [Catellatospora sp. KI3]MDI1465680.1 hypothetical protein [Catellatospora sp. KI3]